MKNQLPTPPKVLQEQSDALKAILKQQINEHNGISFAEYMHTCLYTPGLGYYSSPLTKFGKTGDFVTAPEISPLFSYCLARCIAHDFVLEIGAGSGTMAAHILQYLENNNMPLKHYYILEVSADLRAKQKEMINSIAPNMLDKVIWLDDLPEKFNGIVFANELLDAMPVHMFTFQNNQFLEQFIEIDTGDNFKVTLRDSLPEKAKHYLSQFKNNFCEGYSSEINLAIAPWLQNLYGHCENTQIILIDYGFNKETYYHAERSMGTLMCHYQHMAHDDVFFYPGLQDITAHVDFSFVMENAEAMGFSIEQYCTQAEFLMENGILEYAADDPVEQYQLAQGLKRLLLPSEMGELFKVLVLHTF